MPPYVPITGDIREYDRQRFFDKTQRKRNGCLEWTGAKQESRAGIWYGNFRFNGRSVKAHRFALYLELGHDPGPSVDHLCYNTLCVDRKHLVGGPIADNNSTRRCVIAQHCQKGHERTVENTYITPDGRRQCRECCRISDRKRSKRKYHQLKKTYTHSSTMRDFNANRKLTKDNVREIRRRYAANEGSQRQLAREFKVSQPMIGQIVRFETWKDIE